MYHIYYKYDEYRDTLTQIKRQKDEIFLSKFLDFTIQNMHIFFLYKYLYLKK